MSHIVHRLKQYDLVDQRLADHAQLSVQWEKGAL